MITNAMKGTVDGKEKGRFHLVNNIKLEDKI